MKLVEIINSKDHRTTVDFVKLRESIKAMILSDKGKWESYKAGIHIPKNQDWLDYGFCGLLTKFAKMIDPKLTAWENEHHSFVSDSYKYYDASTPNGVPRWRELALYKNESSRKLSADEHQPSELTNVDWGYFTYPLTKEEIQFVLNKYYNT